MRFEERNGLNCLTIKNVDMPPEDPIRRPALQDVQKCVYFITRCHKINRFTSYLVCLRDLSLVNNELSKIKGNSMKTRRMIS